MKSDLIDLIADNNTNKELLDDFKICIVSNINTEPYFSTYLGHLFKGLNYYVICKQIQLDDSFSVENYPVYSESDYIILWINLHELFPNYENDIMTGNMSLSDYFEYILNFYSTFFNQLKNNESAKVICIGLEDYYIRSDSIIGRTINKYQIADEINLKISKKYPYVRFINLKKILAENGLNNAYDVKNMYRWTSPYSCQIYEGVAYEIYKQYNIKKHITPKCIVLDCDNVLWGGILSEDGIENIKIGELGISRAYQDFQRFILQLYNSGIILAVCSKNDLSDVVEVFEKHKGMILKKDNIAIFSVNWEDKASNIKRISEQLNIGLDSMVFVDDSTFEINLVKQMLVEVTCITFNIYNMYSEFTMFNLEDNLTMSDIKARNESYITNIYRNQLKESASSYDEYLQQLDTKIEIHKAKQDEISRISELSLRAHKFTNGKRYDSVELKQLLGEELGEELGEDKSYELYSVYLSDRFSNLGLVGAFGIKNKTYLDMFVMSCRANGRRLEDRMLKEINSNYNIKEYFFESTNKNQAVADWFNHSLLNN